MEPAHRDGAAEPLEEHRADAAPGVAGINLSESQVYRLVTGTPERIPARTFAALCDILDCAPNDLFEPYVEMRAAKTADAPRRPEDLGVKSGSPIARRVRIVKDDEDG